MAVRQPRYSKEEFARRGDEIYESQVRQEVEEGNHGKIVAMVTSRYGSGWGGYDRSLTQRQRKLVNEARSNILGEAD